MQWLLAQSSDLDNIPTLIKWMGLPGALLFIAVYSLAKGWFVPGWVYKAMAAEREALQKKNDDMDKSARDDREKFLGLILRQNTIVERAVTESVSQKSGGGS